MCYCFVGAWCATVHDELAHLRQEALLLREPRCSTDAVTQFNKAARRAVVENLFWDQILFLF